MYLLDTNIISEFLKKKPNKNLIGKVEAVPAASLYTASICVMELRYGALRTPGHDDKVGGSVHFQNDGFSANRKFLIALQKHGQAHFLVFKIYFSSCRLWQ